MWSTWGASPWEGKSGAEVGIVNRKVGRRARAGQTFPLDAFERTLLLSSVLMPRWVYRSLFVASDQLLHDIDMMTLEFVTTAKGRAEPSCTPPHRPDTSGRHMITPDVLGVSISLHLPDASCASQSPQLSPNDCSLPRGPQNGTYTGLCHHASSIRGTDLHPASRVPGTMGGGGLSSMRSPVTTEYKCAANSLMSETNRCHENTLRQNAPNPFQQTERSHPASPSAS